MRDFTGEIIDEAVFQPWEPRWLRLSAAAVADLLGSGSYNSFLTHYVTSVSLSTCLTVSTVSDRTCVSAETGLPINHSTASTIPDMSGRLPGLERKPGWIVVRVGLGYPGTRNLLESLKKSSQFRQFVSLTSLKFHI